MHFGFTSVMTSRLRGVTMKDNLALIAMVHRAGQIAEALFDEALGRRDITARQAQVLQAVAQNHGANQTQIVIATGIDRSTLGTMCRRLAAKGLITRRRSRQDSPCDRPAIDV